MLRSPGNVSGRDLRRAAERLGWELRRTRGSHAIYAKPDWPTTLSIPVNVKADGTKRSIVRQLMAAEGIER
jgi:predicted RNA binding protein YcfA (HicA-like mRNA interferase family)